MHLTVYPSVHASLLVCVHSRPLASATLAIPVLLLAILLLPESWRSSSFGSAGPAHFHAPAFTDEVDIGAGYLISGSGPGWCCVCQPARFSHPHRAGELFGTAPASSPNSRQQGAEPVFLFLHPGIQFTHTHTIRANPAVLPRQTIGPALPTAALGKGRMRTSSSHLISPGPALLPATGVKERQEEGHFSLPLSPHSKQRGCQSCCPHTHPDQLTCTTIKKITSFNSVLT